MSVSHDVLILSLINSDSFNRAVEHPLDLLLKGWVTLPHQKDILLYTLFITLVFLLEPDGVLFLCCVLFVLFKFVSIALLELFVEGVQGGRLPLIRLAFFKDLAVGLLGELVQVVEGSLAHVGFVELPRVYMDHL